MGALTGLVVWGAVLVAVIRLSTPVAARPRLQASAAVVTSVAAVLCVALLRSRLGTALRTDLGSDPLMRLALFVTFQLGWAFTYWLSAVKLRTDQARYIPAAVGTVFFLGGGLLLQREAQAEPPDPVGEPVYARFATPEELAFAQETARVGEESGGSFAHYHSGREPLLGLRLTTRDWFGRERINSGLQGLFEDEAPATGEQVLLAKPGYVVAAIEVQADDHINAIRLEFAPFDGDLISPDGRYWSPWVGSHASGGGTKRLDGGIGLVVGLKGSSGLVLNSLSLLTVQSWPR